MPALTLDDVRRLSERLARMQDPEALDRLLALVPLLVGVAGASIVVLRDQSLPSHGGSWVQLIRAQAALELALAGGGPI